MIRLSEGGIAEMWKDEKSPEMQAISYALQKAVALVIEKAEKTKCFSDIDNLDEKTLDYFAVEMRSMYYDQSLPIKKKREIIKNTINWYTYAGTPAAVSEMVNVIFGTGRVVEWFDFEDPEEMIPGTFDIVTDAEFSKDIIEQFNKTIKKSKNARSHLRKVIIEHINDANFFVAGRSILHEKISIHDHGIEVTTDV